MHRCVKSNTANSKINCRPQFKKIMYQVSYPIELLIWLNMHRLGYHNCNDQYHNHVRGIVWTAIERRRDARLRHRQRIPQKKKPDLSFALPFLSLVHTQNNIYKTQHKIV